MALQGSGGWFWVVSPAMGEAGTYNLSALVENDIVDSLLADLPVLEVLPGMVDSGMTRSAKSLRVLSSTLVHHNTGIIASPFCLQVSKWKT